MRNIATFGALLGLLLTLLTPRASRADTPDEPAKEPQPEPEQLGESLRMTMSSGAPNQYFFRGLLQSDKGFSGSPTRIWTWPSMTPRRSRLIIPVGFWFSVHPGIRPNRKGTGGLV